MKVNRRKKGNVSDKVFEKVVIAFMVVFLLIVLYPLVYVVSSSFSSGRAVTEGRVLLWPVEFSIDGYRMVFLNMFVWKGYINTIYYTIVGTLVNLVMIVLAAYPLSRKDMQWRNFYAWIFIIPMYFSGGLIPTYMLISKLGLINTRAVLILTGAVGISNIILVRTFFQSSVPIDLLEAAKIDGITDFGYLFKILLPLSKSVLSVVTLYCVVGHWNSYFSGMMYVRERDLWPLQLVLREILYSAKVDATQMLDPTLLAQMVGQADIMKYALIVVSTVPMLILYPFVQKFFEKGVMIGSLKG